FAINSSTGVVTVANSALLNTLTTYPITVQANDNLGGPSSATFTITVVPVNHPPALDVLNGMTLNEDAGAQSVNLSGITIGSGDSGQTLTVTVTSSNTAIVPTPSLGYTPNDS